MARRMMGERAHDDVVVELEQDGARTQGAEPGAHAQGPHEADPSILQQAIAALEQPLKGLKPAQPDQNEPRRRRQEARGPRVVEDGAQSVRNPRATTLVIPESKRCEALTTRGVRCKAPKMRGLKVCMFHGHLSSNDERLAALADPDPSAKPRLSPRSALRAVAEIRAGEIAVRAVDGALTASGRDGGRALLALVDSVDPAREETATLVVEGGDVESLSFAQLTLAVRALIPSGDGMDTGLPPSTL